MTKWPFKADGVAVATGATAGNMRCFRRGQTDQGWRTCHLPWQKNLAFGNRGKNDEKKTAKRPGTIALTNETTHHNTESELADPGQSKGGDKGDNRVEEVRFTEEERIARYNQSLPFTLMMAECLNEGDEHISLTAKMGSLIEKEGEIIFDSGATSTVAGKRWLQGHGWDINSSALKRKPSTKRFRFGDSGVFLV